MRAAKDFRSSDKVNLSVPTCRYHSLYFVIGTPDAA